MSRKLIILSDLGSLKAYCVTRDEITEEQRIDLLQGYDSLEGHERISEVLTDQAGRFPTGNGIGSGQMSHGDRNHLEQEIKNRIVRQLAHDISEIVLREEPDTWYFAANNEIDGKIIDALDASVRQKLSKRVRSNLTKVKKEELLNHFN
jgi:hypothetical protein